MVEAIRQLGFSEVTVYERWESVFEHALDKELRNLIIALEDLGIGPQTLS